MSGSKLQGPQLWLPSSMRTVETLPPAARSKFVNREWKARNIVSQWSSQAAKRGEKFNLSLANLLLQDMSERQYWRSFERMAQELGDLFLLGLITPRGRGKPPEQLIAIYMQPKGRYSAIAHNQDVYPIMEIIVAPIKINNCCSKVLGSV
ncbi:Uncharacterised protein [Zhongshania aliphaticivorans]|nr:Uncharacterised protein [Zhongshania aliphaticivorans]